MFICWLNLREVYKIVVILRYGSGWFMDMYIYIESLLYKMAELFMSKGKFRTRTGHEVPERDWKYRPTLSLASALNGMGG